MSASAPTDPAASQGTAPVLTVSPVMLEPLTAADPLEGTLAQARMAGLSADSTALETWLDLRSLMRAKRPEAALSALERWRGSAAEDASGDTPGDAGKSAGPALAPASVPASTLASAPRTAEQVRAALADADLPAHLSALAAVKRWQTPGSAQSLLAGALSHPLTAAEAWNLLGVLSAETGTAAERRAAADAFARALAADPGHYRALTNRAALALAAEKEGDSTGPYGGADPYSAAEADLREALRLAPDHHAAHQNLAVVLRRQGKRSEAARAQRRAQWLDYRHSGRRSDDQARRELSGLQLGRVPRAAWVVLGALLFFGGLWLFGGR